MGKNDDKTEKPTAKRRKEARKKGQVAKSQELAGWLIVLVATSLLPGMFRSASTRLTGLFGTVSRVMSNPSPGAALKVLQSGLSDVVLILLPMLPIVTGVAILGTVAQTGGQISAHSLKPKWERVNPVAGFKRLVSPQSGWQLAKQVLRLGVLFALAYKLLSHLGTLLVGAQLVALSPVLSYTATSILSMVRDVAAIGLGLAVIDFGIARRRISKAMKMTKQEVKDESYSQEGNPLIKRNVRSKQMQMSRGRMMAAVLTADVVVTNPTHFAVALRYDPASRRAPQVVAKGSDETALRIRQHAQDHDVAVVEDPPLARALYAACEIEDFIPQELFTAVARLLAFVFTLPTTLKSNGGVLRRPTSALVA
ncbi:EscU/YscU/HrcU family type III secretion system export apparatus switch protein [Acidiferrimicrobium sp. IK]|uniref:EscU/YscU/HrcU family type III secretion system export apparatus switch protein n=1 Tax=Acidiferrimicrobium sp. IK TaxID=2871700 RepID=UPI0021CB5348|nr:EscU/YscU/HrcU family type III secretion system export apparatus switch protein [Acidiferrimicrobium sp. IK]MCU4185013.1 EscU/YscU/HrcU family type III secretion system export apparatus switch protein [Acidiferrimicrobium sp. IK]